MVVCRRVNRMDEALEYTPPPYLPLCLYDQSNLTCNMRNNNVTKHNIPSNDENIFRTVSQFHAQITYKDDAFFLTDLCSQHGTWITNNEGRRYRVPPNYPHRVHPSDAIEFGSDQASYRVKVTRSAPRVSQKEGQQNLQKHKL
ncbi:zeaxanthin epoxidase, chloroplastic [Trifolium repens]|nr:zeaxanthin epoxidase, chloroplastic [Trifolium repens]